MGRASITAGGDDGLYTAAIVYDTSGAETALAAIAAELAEIDQLVALAEAEIADAEADLGELDAPLQEALDAYYTALAAAMELDEGENVTHPLDPFNSLSSTRSATSAFEPTPQTESAYGPGSMEYQVWVYLQSAPQYDAAAVNEAFAVVAAVMAERDALQGRITNAEKYRDLQYYRQEALERRREELQQASAPEDPAEMWCADLTEDLSGATETLEIDGAPVHAVLIAPGGVAPLRDTGDTPGLLANVMATSVAACALAWALLPGWQKWRPT
jgi:hypothetical protein